MLRTKERLKNMNFNTTMTEIIFMVFFNSKLRIKHLS